MVSAMDAIEALQQRVSVQRLGGDVPDPAVLAEIYKAALRVPDHAQLKPWRFLQIAEDGRDQLGDLFAKAKQAAEPEISARDLVKTKAKPLRAPLIVVIIASPKEHPKVPEVEQILSAGSAVQNMLVASHALGVGAMWRTGSMAYDPIVRSGLGLAAHEQIVGFLYLGEPQGNVRTAPELDPKQYFVPWPTQD